MDRDYEAVRRELAAAGVDLLVVGPTPNAARLIGYDTLPTDRLFAVLVTATDAAIVLPAMEVSAVQPFVRDELVLGWEDFDGPAGALTEAFARLGSPASVAVDEGVPFHAVAALGAHADVRSMRVAGEILARPRLIKTAEEIDRMAVTGELIANVIDEVLAGVVPGTTERELAGEIARLLWRGGADRETFILVSAGPRAALSHQTPGDAAVQRGESMLVDMATSVDGWWADITRSVFVGEPDAEYTEAYALVAAAQAAGVAAARPGVTAAEVDAATLSVLHDAGYGQWASGRTGHGIGRAVHEDPSIVRGNNTVLEPGMVFTVEPGIYIPGRFGIRLEDTVAVGDPLRNLTAASAKALRTT